MLHGSVEFGVFLEQLTKLVIKTPKTQLTLPRGAGPIVFSTLAGEWNVSCFTPHISEDFSHSTSTEILYAECKLSSVYLLEDPFKCESIAAQPQIASHVSAPGAAYCGSPNSKGLRKEKRKTKT